MSRTVSAIRLGLVSSTAALTVLFAWLAHEAIEGRAVSLSAPFMPSMGMALAVRVDALAALFAILVCGIGALVAAYSASYVEHATGRFYLHLTLFFAAMLGLVVADDLLLLYVCWELTSVSSFFLVGFHHERPEARAAAHHALLVTVLGGLCLFAGLVMIGVAGESFRISELIERDTLRDHHLYAPALILVALGAFTKSAQVPFHSWLPRAMEAPTPASAYLHAATMVKAGVYLLARFSPLLAGTALWSGLLAPVGAITALLGAARALGETKLKRVLAYSTISALGVLVALLGAGTSKAVVAAMVYVVAHALYKGALFLGAGAIHHASGVDDVRELRGLRRAAPLVALAMLLAAASLAGAPPLLGFLGKDLAYEGLWPAVPGDLAALASLLAAFLASALFVAVAVELGLRPFLGRPAGRLAGARDPTPWLWGPPMILAALGLAVGVAPRLLAPLAAAAAADVLRAPVPASAALLHGLTPAVILSVATLAAGALVWAARAPLIRAGGAVAGALRLRPGAGYDLGLRALTSIAERQTRALQSGYLSWYVLALIGTSTLLVAMGLWRAPLGAWERVASDLRLEDLGLVALVLAAALVAVATRSRFAAIAAMGVVGLAVGAIYLTVGAPDLAMTQFVVEVLNVAVFVLAFSRVPGFERLSSSPRRVRDGVVAVAFGAVMLVLVLVAGHTDPHDRVSDWHIANAVTAGHGHNVVNVILTDFRSLDTLGEITVVACAAFGVLALLRLRSAST